MLKSFEGGTGCLPAVVVRVGGEYCVLLYLLFPVSFYHLICSFVPLYLCTTTFIGLQYALCLKAFIIPL